MQNRRSPVSFSFSFHKFDYGEGSPSAQVRVFKDPLAKVAKVVILVASRQSCTCQNRAPVAFKEKKGSLVHNSSQLDTWMTFPIRQQLWQLLPWFLTKSNDDFRLLAVGSCKAKITNFSWIMNEEFITTSHPLFPFFQVFKTTFTSPIFIQCYDWSTIWLSAYLCIPDTWMVLINTLHHRDQFHIISNL